MRTGLAPTALDGREAAASVRRLANDSVAEVAARFDQDEGGVYQFLCECGDLTCLRVVEMTLADYRTRKPGSVVGHA